MTGLKILTICQMLCEHSLEASEKFEDNEKMMVLSQLSSARLTAQSCVKVATNNQWESCKEISDNICKMLDQIVGNIKKLQ